MEDASEGMRAGDQESSAREASRAREALEEAIGVVKDRLDRLRAKQDFKQLKGDQDSTREKTDDLVQRMREPPPLVGTPEEGVPGRNDVQGASEDMESASQGLGGGRPARASRSQKKALDRLREGREKVEDALEALQQAFRDRLLAYLREKFTRMLNEQRLITRDTTSLDLKLRALRAALPEGSSAEPEIARADRQLAQSLCHREEALSLLADDVLDVLTEDGTTLVFPGVVGQIRGDILNVAGLLSRIQTGERTQYIERQIESAIEDILRALDEAQRNPPPPNPSQGRQSPSGAGPLLPVSTELKLVRALQARVNERTRDFDRSRPAEGTLDPEDKLQVDAIAKKQKEVEGMMRDLSRAIGER
jgi:hypothetical protein